MWDRWSRTLGLRVYPTHTYVYQLNFRKEGRVFKINSNLIDQEVGIFILQRDEIYR